MGVLSSKTDCMKTKFILLFLVIFPSCIAQEKKALDSIFNQTKKIEIIAFYDRDKWEREDYSNITDNIKENKVEIKEKYLRNRIILDDSQIKKLKKGLSSCEPVYIISDCYLPRHAIIFYDKNDNIFGFIELCFDCNGYISSPNLKFLSDCALRQEDLFKEFGITYFSDTEQEMKELKRKWEEEEKNREERFKKIKEKRAKNE
jgi:hypothetical protein